MESSRKLEDASSRDNIPILYLGGEEKVVIRSKTADAFNRVLSSTNLAQFPDKFLPSPKLPKKTKQVVLFEDGYRYLVLCLGWMSLAAIAANMNLYNMTKLCMFKEENYTSVNYFTEVEHNKLIMAAAIGTAVGTAPFSWLFTRYKAKYPFFAAGVLSAGTTFLIPAAVQQGFTSTWLLRFLQGTAYAADFAAMGVLCAIWSPLSQAALFISMLTCYNSLAVLFSSPVAGLLCRSSFGWDTAYYTHVMVTVVLLMTWLLFYGDSPISSRFVSQNEFNKIQKNKSLAHKTMNSKVPYKKIIRNKLVWVIWFNAFMDIFSGIFALTYEPTYLSKVLHFDVTQIGFLAIVGPMVHIPLKFVFGTLSDRIKFISERRKMIMFNSFAVFGPSLSYLLLAFAPTDYPLLSILAFMANGIFFSTAGGGFYKCATLCFRQYAHVVIASMQFTKALTMFLGPVLVNVFVVNIGNQYEWRNLFLLVSISLATANLLFAFNATDQPADFTRTEIVKNIDIKAPNKVIPM
ncbi:unnamed protein product [Bursaphelenchus okinawaensis]|uniref:Major facilitator superfamily (MFS) profile domain-containing protein n=1 Tax=Bursaphelenchus okinawaensis TaxID=465554 RepID=A0A811KSN1_9BILA|nr:unnamed protein product [Bursaphelenchus okinawaensis]CAG9112659.1 unnamed protein product [Bursaphelenchus okinawaensis]